MRRSDTRGRGEGLVPGRSVQRSSRARLLEAMADGIAACGYPDTTVADVVRRAKTSRRTFYQHFPDREACFLALLSEHCTQVIRRIRMSVDVGASAHLQVRQAIEAWAEYCDAHPGVAKAFVRDAPAVRSPAARRQVQFTEAFVALVQSLCEQTDLGPVSRPRAIIVVGGLLELAGWTLDNDGRLGDVADEAVSAALALLVQRDHRESPSPTGRGVRASAS